jgi:hypothetical protein
MIECLKEGWQVETVNSCHEYGERYYDAGDVYGEPGMVEESVEHYAHRLAARNDAEYVESHREVEGCGAGEADGEGAEYGEEKRCQDFERDFKKRVREEESGEWV